VEKAEETVKFSVKFNLIMMILVSVVAIIFPENIMKLFISDKNVIEIGILMIRIIIPSLIFGGISMGISSAFSGSGYNIPYLISSFISRWLVQVPMLFIVTNLLQLPIIFLWISFMVTDISEMLIIILLYKNGKWKTKRV
jgi:Na+-driven multidrug efflux pump